MEYIAVLLVAGAVFGLCWLLDKGFAKLFRNQAQHMSGLAVRLNKRYGAIGFVVAALGVASMVAGGTQGNVLLLVAGALLIAMGVALVVYYSTFGVFYDEEGFLLTTFGKRSKPYRYADIQGQQLYVSYGNIIIELYLADGRTFQLQSGMSGAYPFLDKAFARWVEQTGRREEDCAFHDPANSCWFPKMDDTQEDT